MAYRKHTKWRPLSFETAITIYGCTSHYASMFLPFDISAMYERTLLLTVAAAVIAVISGMPSLAGCHFEITRVL